MSTYTVIYTQDELRFEAMRKKFLIQQTSLWYQIWKIVAIILSFVSSFRYAYFSTFMHKMNEEELSYFVLVDYFFDSFFIFDVLLHILVDEHDD